MTKARFLLPLLAAYAPFALATDAGTSAEGRYQELAQRIEALESESQKLREQAAAALAAAQAAKAELEQLKATRQEAAVAAVVTPAAPAPAPASSANAFNPAISVILNGTYAHHSLDPDDYVRAGFPLVGEGGPGEQGFSLGESEIALSANVDDKFYGQLVAALEEEDGETEAHIEEAYIDTMALPQGFSLRAGRFFSNIGYLNSHHAHTDSFTDRPLAYQAFLGNQYGDDGMQLRYVPALDLFLEFSGELLRGDEYPSGGAAHSGVGARTLAVHAGGDVGIESSWLAGVSVLDTDVENGADGFEGDERLYLADFTWKWAPNGNTKDGGVTLRGEYFHEDRDGQFVDPADAGLAQPWNGSRRGAYLEGVYRIDRRWDAGYRYDRLWADDSGPYASSFDPRRHTVELTWRNSEFSLVRLQLSHDEPRQDRDDDAVYLQYQMHLGAHGAHKF